MDHIKWRSKETAYTHFVCYIKSIINRQLSILLPRTLLWTCENGEQQSRSKQSAQNHFFTNYVFSLVSFNGNYRISHPASSVIYNPFLDRDFREDVFCRGVEMTTYGFCFILHPFVTCRFSFFLFLQSLRDPPSVQLAPKCHRNFLLGKFSPFFPTFLPFIPPP